MLGRLGAFIDVFFAVIAGCTAACGNTAIPAAKTGKGDSPPTLVAPAPIVESSPSTAKAKTTETSSTLQEPEPIEFSGGDGSSCAQAVIIKHATEETGVKAEYQWLQQKFPDYAFTAQTLGKCGPRVTDVFTITAEDGNTRQVFFDITDFLGRI